MAENTGVFVGIEGVNELIRAMQQAPDLTYKFVGQEMRRGVNRFRKDFIKGWPLKWTNAKKVGGNVNTKVTGSSLSNIAARVTLSRILAIHETGGTITGKDGGALAIPLRKDLPHKPSALNEPLFVLVAHDGKAYLARKRAPEEKGGAIRDSRGKFVKKSFEGDAELLYRLVSRVQIKPKLHFYEKWNAYVPEFTRRIEGAVDRSLKVAMDRKMRSIANTITGLTESL